MSIETVNFPTVGYIKQGDTIPKKTLIFGGDWAGDFLLSALWKPKMQIYNGSKKIIDISEGSGITVIDSNTIEIDEIVQNDLPIGCFTGDFQVEEYVVDAFDPVNVTTYFNVKYTIIEQYTK